MVDGFLNLARNGDMILVLQASEPLAWFFTSYPAFVLTIHQSPGPQRWALLPINVLGPLLCLVNVHKLASGLDWLWAFTSIICIVHIIAGLYIERWRLPPDSLGWSLLACYKAWINPRRLAIRLGLSTTQLTRLQFAVRKTALILAIWISYIVLELAIRLAVKPRHHDFGLDARSFVHLALDRRTALRTIYAFHWAYLTYIILTVTNACLAILFVAILQLDVPEEWPPLWGNPSEAYSLRRFWGVFWHKIGAPSQSVWGLLIAREGLGTRSGSTCEKVFLAFWVFAVSGATHVVVNWVTRATAPTEDVLGDMMFLMLNFLGGLSEVELDWMMGRSRRPHRSRRGRVEWWQKIVGFCWVFIFFYCIVPPWQYPHLHADAMSRLPGYKLDVQIPKRAD